MFYEIGSNEYKKSHFKQTDIAKHMTVTNEFANSSLFLGAIS